MDTQRIVALIIFVFSGMMLWTGWQKHNAPPVITPAAAVAGATAANGKTTDTVPTASANPATPGTATAPGAATADVPPSGKRISVRTDLLSAEIDTAGGDLREVVLLKQPAHGDATHPMTLMQDKVGHYFITQSGLLGGSLPNHTAKWVASQDKYELASSEKIEVRLTNTDAPGLTVAKVFTFTRGSYVVDLRYDIRNDSGNPVTATAYYQFLRDGHPPEGESSGGNMFTGGVSTFTGPAVYTDAKHYQKVAFTEVDKGKAEYVKDTADGWIAMVQHYFVSVWMPEGNGKREFFIQKWPNDLYTAGVKIVLPAVAAGAQSSYTMPLYVGPQEQEHLNKLRPGLDLVVDYGVLKILATPMFEILSWINKIVGNWGWTIIIFTILIKLVFFPLNQKAGKSMAHMKTMAPKMEALKQRYGDDKVKLNQAMMEMYKTEKINPLGGCLPILVQMPFFIALYWVLLGAVELRNAPWIGWLHDLSTPDPYYVLPVIMGVSMLVQTKLNPAPPDPVQAKVMMIMPVVFSFMFLFFPAGLVLYWTMQNLLGIAQQWYINKHIKEMDAKDKAAGK